MSKTNVDLGGLSTEKWREREREWEQLERELGPKVEMWREEKGKAEEWERN